jgi:hypothetical protein
MMIICDGPINEISDHHFGYLGIVHGNSAS